MTVKTLEDWKEHAEEWEALAYRYQAERDALAAHVERLREALRLAKINLAYSEDGFAPQYRNICRKALEATPQASLAHLKAEWQAEALENLAAEFREAWPHHNGKHAWIIGAGVQIRRQAKET